MLIIFMSMIVPPTILPFMKHPLSVGVLLLTEMLLIVLTASTVSVSYWYSYLTFLIMVGGMLVIFMYMTSVASNEKFKFSWTIMASSIFMFLIFIIFQINFYWKEFFKMTYLENFKNMKPFFFSMNKLLNEPTFTLSMLLIIYLLITLIAVIKIINIKSGPIRHMN